MSERIRKLLLYQEYITFCLQREIGLLGGVTRTHALNKRGGSREVDKIAKQPSSGKATIAKAEGKDNDDNDPDMS